MTGSDRRNHGNHGELRSAAGVALAVDAIGQARDG